MARTPGLSVVELADALLLDAEFMAEMERPPTWREDVTLPNLRALARDGTHEPHGRDGVHRLATYLFSKRVDPYIVWALLALWAEFNCETPLDPRDVERITRAAYRANKRVAP